MPTDLQTTNMWLAIGAIAIAIQTLMLLAAAFMGFRLYRKFETTMDDLETRYVQPAEARLMALMDDVQDVTARVRRVDDTIRARLADIGGAAEGAKEAVATRAWPIVGVVRAIDAGLRALASRRSVSDVEPPVTNRRSAY